METPTLETVSAEINALERDVTTIAKGLPMGGEILAMFARRTCGVLRRLNDRVDVAVQAAAAAALIKDTREG